MDEGLVTGNDYLVRCLIGYTIRELEVSPYEYKRNKPSSAFDSAHCTGCRGATRQHEPLRLKHGED